MVNAAHKSRITNWPVRGGKAVENIFSSLDEIHGKLVVFTFIGNEWTLMEGDSRNAKDQPSGKDCEDDRRANVGESISFHMRPAMCKIKSQPWVV